VSEESEQREEGVDVKELRQSFLEHVQEFRLHEEEDQRRWAQQQKLLAGLTKATERNAEAIKDLTAATKGVVELHRDVIGAARTGKRVQAMAAWVLKWGALGTATVAAVTYLTEKLGGN
jgi:hypothetical protein